MIHLRIISPADQADEVLDLLKRCPSTTSVVAYRGAAVDPPGDVISCDVAEEDASYLVADLRAMRIHERGSVDLERIDATVSTAADEAERRTPGASADAVLWENVGAKIADQGFLSWGLIALFSLAGVIAGVGILIDSAPIVVGAMAVSPDFGPIAAFSVGVVRRRRDYALGGFLAVVAGFTAAIIFAFVSDEVPALDRRRPGRVPPGREHDGRGHRRPRRLLGRRRALRGRRGHAVGDARQVGRPRRRRDLDHDDPGRGRHRALARLRGP